MPLNLTKKERSEAFANRYNEAKPKLEPEDREEWLIESYSKHRSKKCKDGTPYEVEIVYEHYRPWPGCPWPDPWRVDIIERVARKDIGWPGGGNATFFGLGDFCENRKKAKENAQDDLNSEPTF